MDFEYSNKEGYKYAYTFTKFERNFIAEALAKRVKVFESRIRKIENNPRNEGQATYLCRIDDIVSERKSIEEIIKEFKS